MRAWQTAAISPLGSAGNVNPCSYQLILERFPLRYGDVGIAGTEINAVAKRPSIQRLSMKDAPLLMSIKATLPDPSVVRNGSDRQNSE